MWNYFRVARNPSRIDVKRGDHFLQADIPGLIRTMPKSIASESPTTRPDTYFAHQRRLWKARMALRYEIKTSKYHFQVLAEWDVAVDMLAQCWRGRTPCNSERASSICRTSGKGPGDRKLRI
jgi:hypothetical protein